MKFIYVWIAEETGKGSESYVLHAETFQDRDKTGKLSQETEASVRAVA